MHFKKKTQEFDEQVLNPIEFDKSNSINSVVLKVPNGLNFPWPLNFLLLIIINYSW